jgi:hypothetical protein
MAIWELDIMAIVLERIEGFLGVGIIGLRYGVCRTKLYGGELLAVNVLEQIEFCLSMMPTSGQPVAEHHDLAPQVRGTQPQQGGHMLRQADALLLLSGTTAAMSFCSSAVLWFRRVHAHRRRR